MPQNELFTAPNPETQIRQFSPADTAIAKLAADYMPLKIAGIDDKAGFAAVHAARMVVRQYRIDVEKKRKELKADALKYGQAVDGEARRITGLLEPIETHLASEEDRIEVEKEAIRNAARLKAEAEAKAKADAEAARLKAEQEAENTRLAAERVKLDAERKAIEAERSRQQAEQAKIDADRRKVEDDARKVANAKAEAERKKLVEEASRLRAECEKIEAEKRAIEGQRRKLAEQAARESADKARKEAEAARIAKALAMRPDREKLLAVADAIASIAIPEVSCDASAVRNFIVGMIADGVGNIRRYVNEKLPLPADDEEFPEF